MYQLTFHDEKTDAVITISGGTIDEQYNIIAKVLEMDPVTIGVDYKGVTSVCGNVHPVVQEQPAGLPIPYGFEIPKEPVSTN